MYIANTDGSWNESKKVNAPELMEGMIGVYWDEAGNEHELTEESTKEEWEQWYDYTGETGTNRWANAITKDTNGKITGYWVWIPRFAYKIEDGLFTSSTTGKGGTVSIKFLQNASDVDETGTQIGREYEYLANQMTEYVIHPAFRDGSLNNYRNGEWDEEIRGFWMAKYEAGYQANTITDTNGTLSTDIFNEGDQVIYSNLYYTSYYNEYATNPLKQDLSSTGYSNQKLSYPVFLPLTYSYNNIAIGDSYILSQSIDTATNFYGLNASVTDSHMMKNSEWGAVAYLTQSSYGRDKLEITINNYYNSISSPYRVSVTGLAGVDISATSETNLNNVSAYYTEAGTKASTTGNITGIYDLSGGLWERVAGYISNGNSYLTRTGNDGSSGGLMGATNTADPNGYLTLSKRSYTVYPYYSLNDNYSNNYDYYKGLLSGEYGYGNAILETSGQSGNSFAWNSDYSYFAYHNYPFFTRSGGYDSASIAGIFNLADAYGSAYYYYGFRTVLVAE